MTMFYAAEGGGVRTYLAAKSRWLAQRAQIRHSLLSSARPVSGDCSFIPVPGVPIPSCNGYRMPLSIDATVRRLHVLRPSLIEVGDPYQFAWAAVRAKHRTGVPIVAFYHSDMPQVIGRRLGRVAGQAALRYLRALYRRFDLVLAPSRRMADFLRENGIDRVVHQPLGVDTTSFSPSCRDRDFRARLALPASTRLLVYAGRFTHEKKLPLLIEAVRTLGAPYHLLLIGSGASIAASPRITCLPYQANSRLLSGLLASCDLLVHPGDQETFGLVVLEAMASGVPVLGVASGGVAELIDNATGLLVAPGSSAALADGIRQLFRQDLAQMGRQARERVCLKYDWNRILPQIIGHYGCLFAGHQRAELEARLAYGCE